jgi:hypothetical protein
VDFFGLEGKSGRSRWISFEARCCRWLLCNVTIASDVNVRRKI